MAFLLKAGIDLATIVLPAAIFYYDSVSIKEEEKRTVGTPHFFHHREEEDDIHTYRIREEEEDGIRTYRFREEEDGIHTYHNREEEDNILYSRSRKEENTNTLLTVYNRENSSKRDDENFSRKNHRNQSGSVREGEQNQCINQKTHDNENKMKYEQCIVVAESKNSENIPGETGKKLLVTENNRMVQPLKHYRGIKKRDNNEKEFKNDKFSEGSKDNSMLKNVNNERRVKVKESVSKKDEQDTYRFQRGEGNQIIDCYSKQSNQNCGNTWKEERNEIDGGVNKLSYNESVISNNKEYSKPCSKDFKASQDQKLEFSRTVRPFKSYKKQNQNRYGSQESIGNIKNEKQQNNDEINYVKKQEGNESSNNDIDHWNKKKGRQRHYRSQKVFWYHPRHNFHNNPRNERQEPEEFVRPRENDVNKKVENGKSFESNEGCWKNFNNKQSEGQQNTDVFKAVNRNGNNGNLNKDNGFYRRYNNHNGFRFHNQQNFQNRRNEKQDPEEIVISKENDVENKKSFVQNQSHCRDREFQKSFRNQSNWHQNQQRFCSNRRNERQSEESKCTEDKNSGEIYTFESALKESKKDLRGFQKEYGNHSGNWHGRKFERPQGEACNLKKNKTQFHHNNDERNNHCPDQRISTNFSQNKKVFVNKPDLKYNHGSRPGSVQSNYQDHERETSGTQNLERPSSSQSDYLVGQRNSSFIYTPQNRRNFSTGKGNNHQYHRVCNQRNYFQHRNYRNNQDFNRARSQNHVQCKENIHKSGSSNELNSSASREFNDQRGCNNRRKDDQERRWRERDNAMILNRNKSNEELFREEKNPVTCNSPKPIENHHLKDEDVEDEDTEDSFSEENNSDTEDESDEPSAENDSPFQILSLDFKEGFPLNEEEAAQRNIDLDEKVEDVVLFGKEGDVVITKEPKNLRDMMRFMQTYPNATAVAIK